MYRVNAPPPPRISNMVMYVDHTSLCCDIKYDIKYENLLNVKLCKITNWLAANKLSLDVGETKYMVSHSDKKKVLYPKTSKIIMKLTLTYKDYMQSFRYKANATLSKNTDSVLAEAQYTCRYCSDIIRMIHVLFMKKKVTLKMNVVSVRLH